MAIKKENVLGVDIGGSKVNFIVWDGQKIIGQKQITGAPNKDNLKAIVGEWGLRKIGVGVPGVFDATSGRIIKCPNATALNGLNLQKLWPDKIVKIDNDVHCFLRAEAILGSGRGYNNILAVAFGTGIGGAIAIANLRPELRSRDFKLQISNCGLQTANLLLGRDDWAGEFGHMVIDRGQDWEKLYQKTKNKPEEQEKINAIGLANLINILNPEIVILGGKGAKLPKKEIISQYLLLPKKQMPKIVLAKLGQNSAAIGAALLFANIKN